MNGKKPSNSLLSDNCTEKTSPVEEEETLEEKSSPVIDDEQPTSETTYELFFWFLAYVKMYIIRLVKDIFQSVMRYFYSDKVLPEHIIHLMKMQLELYRDRESHTTSYSREHQPTPRLTCSMKKFISAIKSYILYSEDDLGIHYTISKHHTENCGIEKEPMFVIVDSSGLSNPSSKELLIGDPIHDKDTVLRKYFNKYIKTAILPSTSKELAMPPQPFIESESREELEVIDINLQSEHDIAEAENLSDHDNSIVLDYIRKRNKESGVELEGTMLLSKKKASLLESVPKMETIVEGQRFTPFPTTSTNLLIQTRENSNEESLEEECEISDK